MARARQGGDPTFDPSTWFDAIEQRISARIDAIESHVTEAVARLDMTDSTALRATVTALQMDMTAQREDVRSLEVHVRKMSEALSTAAEAGHDDTEELLAAITEAAASNRPQVESEAALTRAVLERVVLRLEEMSGKVERLETGGLAMGASTPDGAADSGPGVGAALEAIADFRRQEDEGRHELADLVRVASARINVVAEELGHLGRRIVEPDPNLARVESALAELRDALGAVATAAPVAAAPVDLGPILARLDTLTTPTPTDLGPILARLDQLASSAGTGAGPAEESTGQGTERLEAALTDLRRRVDHQRKLSDSLAAQVSQMNAALVQASEEPQQLRRDLERIVQQLGETIQAGLRDVRSQVDTAN